MMKKAISITLCLCALIMADVTMAHQKEPLKVLYVGGMTDIYEPAPEEKDGLVKQRTQAFKEMLQDYFTSVTTIDGNDYHCEMSKDYDVTILDGKPLAIKPEILERDASGNIIKYERETYLPIDFDCPIITIAQIGEIVGRGIGSKNDWYCLCLDAQAHSWNKAHRIFSGPFKTDMTVEMCPTPADAYHYKYYYNAPVPDSLPMWRVQTEGYKSNGELAIGMVARPWGYTDSPDAEYISSGVCAKTLDAVAIGRHGNFLHWGFAASPLYMTDEAKTVFANAVVYISGFKGKKLLARKFNDRIATREYLREIKHLVKRSSYEERMVEDSIWNENGKKTFALLSAKKASGQKLTKMEQIELGFGEPGEFQRRPYSEYVKNYGGEFFEMFGTDEDAYEKYFNDNHDYFFSEGYYNMFVDEDVKAWGIPNYDKKLIDRAISALEQGEEIDRAKRVLSRYTMANFDTPEEWRNWYETYKDKMFFTESGGWKFLINAEGDIPGNDYVEYMKRMDNNRTASTGNETSHNNPVLASASISTDNWNKRRIVIKFKIHPGYHIYANVSGEDPYIPTSVSLSLPEGVKSGEWKMTRPGQFGKSGTTIYENEAEFSCPIDGHTSGPVTCTISYQVCDSHICMPPVKTDLKLVI